MLHLTIDSTQKAPEPRPRAFFGAASLVWTRQRILWAIFAVNLLVAFAGVSGVAHNVGDNSGAALNHSAEAARRLVHGFDLSAIEELSELPQQPLRGEGFMFIWPSVFFAIFMIFVTGGVLVSYYDDLRLDAAGFFEACGRHFWRYVRLALYFLILMIPIALLASLFTKLYGNVDDASISPYPAVIFGIVAAAFILFLLLSVRLWFDMAQVIAMAKNERRMYRMLARAGALVWNNFGSLFWLYLRISVVGWIVFGAGLYVWMTILRPEATPLAFLLGQAMIVVWLGTRLWQRAGETEWYKQYRVSLYQPVPMPQPPPSPAVLETLTPS